MTDISVVVPVYNEEENVALLCEKLHNSLSRLGKSYEAVLIDDGSQDSTWQKLLEATRKYPCFHIIKLRRNFGQTAAMAAGFRESKGEIIITLDADLQNDPNDIPKILEKMSEGYDVVSGWRKDRKDPFINRRLPSMIANGLISKITGVYLHDYGCTLKAYHRDVIKNINLYGEMHRFIPALASWAGARTAEVVVNHYPRQFGKSKYGISRTFKVVLDLITVKFLLNFSTKPIHVFGKLGLGSFLFGFFFLLAMTAMHLLYKVGIGYEWMALMVKKQSWLMASFMLMFFGIQFLSMGILAEFMTRIYHESQDKPIYVIKETALSDPKK